MKTAYSVIALFLVFLLTHSCKNDHASDAELLYSTWEAKTFMSIESVAYPKNENKPILLTLKSDGSYQLKLDINSGWGTYTLDGNNQINFGVAAVTEACCDSKFSEKLTTMISRVTSYSFSGKNLRLNVPQWGYIELERVN